jgi:putative salt-induced outer membrane protein
MFIGLTGVSSIAAASDMGYDALLQTAVASDNRATFETILDTALATWPDDREAILALAQSLKPEWLEPAQVAEVAEAEKRKAAAEKASRDRGIIYYLDPALWNGQAELGASSSTGDSDEQSGSLGLSFNRSFGDRWEHDLDLKLDVARANGVTSKERFVTKYEALWKPWDETYLVNYTEFELDKFSGYDYRLTETIGVGYQLIETAKQNLRLEGGPGIRINKIEAVRSDGGILLTPAETQYEFIGRLSSTYSLQLTENLMLEDRASVLFGTESTTVENWIRMSARINAHLAARVSFEARYDSAPPLGTEAWDTITRATLVYDF